MSHHAVLSHILCCCDKFELQPFDRALQSIAARMPSCAKNKLADVSL